MTEMRVTKFAVGQEVWVPKARIGLNPEGPSMLARAKVASVASKGRSVVLDLSNGTQKSVASSALHAHVGVLIVRVGDLASEDTMLDPLAKSLLHYCRLLVGSDVRLFQARSRAELSQFWHTNHAIYSTIVLVGHGSPDAVLFAVDGPSRAPECASLFRAPSEIASKVFISLACRTGHAAFAKEFSKDSVCSALIAPFDSIHSAVASQFLQSFLVETLVVGRTIKVGFNRARNHVSGTTTMRLWRAGALA